MERKTEVKKNSNRLNSYPSRTSVTNIPKRSKNSSNVLFVGYPAQLILIASSTPCQILIPAETDVKKEQFLK